MYNNILVPLDGSELAECVISHVKAIVNNNKATKVTLLYIVEPLEVPLSRGEYKKMIEADARSAAVNYLNRISGQLNLVGVNLRTEVNIGKPADSISSYANKNMADLIIMATHGRSGFQRWFLGSIADRVIHSVNIPVLLIHPAP